MDSWKSFNGLSVMIIGSRLACLPFTNSEFHITCQSHNDIYIRIWREVRRSPFIGMKQPTPHGGICGLQCMLEVKKSGLKAAGLYFILYRNKKEIQRGILNDKGIYEGLAVKLESTGEYLIKIFDVNQTNESCNNEHEEIYESNRLVNSSVSI